MAAIAVPVETSPHPMPVGADDIEALNAAAQLLREAASAGDRLVTGEAEHIERLIARWQQTDGDQTDASTKTLPVDGFEGLACGLAAPRAAATGQPALAAQLEAFWQRWLEARDAHLEEQPHAVRQLRYLMSEITEISCSAGWVDSTPYICWQLAEGSYRKQDDVPAELVARLQRLREQASGWWVWPATDYLGVDWMAPEMLFVPLEEWRTHIAKSDSRERTADLLRWTGEAFPDSPPPVLAEIYRS